MNITIENKRISGTIGAVEYAPLVHRYLICQALTANHGQPVLTNYSEDIRATLDCLEELETDLMDSSNTRHTCYFECRKSTDTFELLLPVSAALCRNSEFIMDVSLPEDPVADIFKSLKVHGVRHEFISNNRLRVWGKMTAGTYIIPAETGSGFISGLLMALPLLKENSVVMVDGSLTYVSKIKMTLQVLERAGIRIDAQINEDPLTMPDFDNKRRGTYIGATFKIQGNQKYNLQELPEIEGDWSLAAFLLTAGAVCGGPVTVSGLKTSTLQKSRAILDILKNAGAVVEYGNEMTEENKRGLFRSLKSRNIGGIVYSEEACDATHIRVTGSWTEPSDLGRFFQRERLHAVDVDMKQTPDLVPALALLATAAQGVSCFRNIAEAGMDGAQRTGITARRIALIVSVLERLGIMIWESDGNIYIEGYRGSEPLSGGHIGCAGDGRIAMMEGIASCISSAPVMIEDAESVCRDYPEFFDDLLQLQV